jgi:hypothetical protein
MMLVYGFSAERLSALSQLFDFIDGWLYVFGVGVVGGMMPRGEGVHLR